MQNLSFEKIKHVKKKGEKKRPFNPSRYILYGVLSYLTGRKRRTIHQFFCNNKLDIENIEHFISYLGNRNSKK